MTDKLFEDAAPNIPDEFKLMTEEDARRYGLKVGQIPLGNLEPILDRLFEKIDELEWRLNNHIKLTDG